MKRFSVTIKDLDCDETLLDTIEEMLLGRPEVLAYESEWCCGEVRLTFDYDGDPGMLCIELRLRYDVGIELD